MKNNQQKTTNEQKMLAALKRSRNDIACLADWIEMALDAYDDQVIDHDEHGFTWSDVCSLQKVRYDLLTTLAFFNGHPDDTKQLERSLDELQQ